MSDSSLFEDHWLSIAKRLQALASTGLHFGESDFDLERYQEIHQLASQMLADLGQIPIETINGLLSHAGRSYETPQVDVRGAVFRGEEVLLVKEKLDGLWTLPGGYADVGISGANNIVKEIFEEATLRVTAERLYAVVHKAQHEYDMDIRDFYKLYFICNQVDDAEPQAGAEVSDAGFFPLDELPPLSTGRVIEKHIRLAEEFRHNPTKTTIFD